MSISLHSLHWLAGFIEADGHIRKKLVTAAQVQRWPLEKIQILFHGKITLNDRSKIPNTSDIYTWRLYGKHGIALMMTLYPLMSPKRQEQIRNALSVWRYPPEHGKHKRMRLRTHCNSGHPFDLFNTGHSRGYRYCKPCKVIYSQQLSVRRRLARRRKKP